MKYIGWIFYDGVCGYDDSPVVEADSRKEAWEKIKAWIKKTLGDKQWATLRATLADRAYIRLKDVCTIDEFIERHLIE